MVRFIVAEQHTPAVLQRELVVEVRWRKAENCQRMGPKVSLYSHHGHKLCIDVKPWSRPREEHVPVLVPVVVPAQFLRVRELASPHPLQLTEPG